MTDRLVALWRRVTKRKALRDAYAKLMTTETGKLIALDLAKFCGQNDPIMDTGDTNRTYARLGARSVFLRIKSMAGLTDMQIDEWAKAEAERIVETE